MGVHVYFLDSQPLPLYQSVVRTEVATRTTCWRRKRGLESNTINGKRKRGGSGRGRNAGDEKRIKLKTISRQTRAQENENRNRKDRLPGTRRRRRRPPERRYPRYVRTTRRGHDCSANATNRDRPARTLLWADPTRGARHSDPFRDDGRVRGRAHTCCPRSVPLTGQRAFFFLVDVSNTRVFARPPYPNIYQTAKTKENYFTLSRTRPRKSHSCCCDIVAFSTICIFNCQSFSEWSIMSPCGY